MTARAQNLTGPFGVGNPYLLLTFTALCWAGNAIAGQLAVGEISPMALVLARWVLVMAILWPLYGGQVLAHWRTARPHMGRILTMTVLGFTGFNALFYIASHYTSGVNIGILQGSMPVFVLVGVAIFYGTRVTGRQAAGVLTTLIGVILVATQGNPALVLAAGINPGDGLFLIACVFYSAYTILLQRRPAMPGAVFFTLLAPIATLTSVPLVIAEAALGQTFVPSLEGWLVTLFVAVFPSCLAQLAFLRGVDLIGAGRAGVFINLVPVFAAFLAVAILGQSFGWFHGVALALVLGGIALAQSGQSRSSR